MLKFLTRTPVFFDADDDGGSGAPAADSSWKADGAAALAAAEAADDAGLTPETPAPAADAPAPDAPAADAPAGDPELDALGAEPPAAVGEPVPDIADQVEQWGGVKAVQAAVELDQALGTREGALELVREAGKALFGDDPEKAALLQQLLGVQGEQPADPIADLLADPERVLTVEELNQVVEARVNEVLKQHITPLEQQREADRVATITATVDSAITEFGVEADDRQEVLARADKYVTEADYGDQAKLKDAIRRGKADWDAFVQKRAEAYLAAKKQSADDHPTPLTSGTAPGGTEPSEPMTLKEAKERVRASMPDEFSVR